MQRCAMLLALAACGGKAAPASDPPATAARQCDPAGTGLAICTEPAASGKTTITLLRNGILVWTDEADALHGVHVDGATIHVVEADGTKDWVVDLAMDDTGVKETNRVPSGR